MRTIGRRLYPGVSRLPYSARMKLLVSLILWSTLYGSSLATPALAAPRNVLLSKDRTEPVVAVDPRQPATILVGSNTNYDVPVNGTYPAGLYTSQNAGQRFGARSMPTVRPYTIAADPTVAFAKSGTAFFSYLGESPAYCGGAVGSGAVMLSRSTDEGSSFSDPQVVDANSADDKPNMAIQSVPGARAHVFITWTRWLNGRSEIWLTRSLNGGDSFASPQLIFSSTLNNFGSVPLVGPGGRVYVLWSSYSGSSLTTSSPTRILFRASSDDGRDFGQMRVAAGPFQGVPRMAQPGLLRNLPVPAAAVGAGGAILLAYSRVASKGRNGAVNADIDLTISHDNGSTWTPPVALNDVHSGDRFMPAMSVMPDGSIGVAFYDRRRSMADLDIYAVRVRYTGMTIRISRNIRVNEGVAPISDIYYIKPGSTCFSPGRFFGDYIAVAGGPHDRLCVVWADTQLHVADRTDIWFAAVHLPTLPEAKHRATLSGTPINSDVVPHVTAYLGRVERELLSLLSA